MKPYQLQHAINWWNNGGNFNTDLMEKILQAKAKLTPKNTFKKRLNIQSTCKY